MRLFDDTQNHLPLTWWKGRPIYLAAILALVGLASMVLTAILGRDAAGYLVFSYDNFFRHRFVWTMVTYVLANAPGLGVIIGCLVLWFFGEGLERRLGRRAFIRLIIGFLFVSPLLLSLLSVLGVGDIRIAGIEGLSLGVFAAFVFLHPRAQIPLIVVTLELWMLAAVTIGISILWALMNRDWVSLMLLAGQVGTAYGMIRFERRRLDLPSFKQAPGRHSLPGLPVEVKKRPVKRARPATRAELQVDDILDKISREGMHSLTPEERNILDRASDDLQKRKR